MIVESTWGDGPDVTLSLDGKMMVCLEAPVKNGFVHGGVSKGTLDLTSVEARALAASLVMAASISEDLQTMCEDHDKE